MITREGQKKLTNVSVIALKKSGRRYEVAVYPNKLYEYKNDPSVPLSDIIHTRQVYRSVATGDAASNDDMKLLASAVQEEGEGADISDDGERAIRYILSHGHEQKAQATSQYETEAVERRIVDLVQQKVLYNGAYVPHDILLKFVRSVHDIKNTDPKKQVSAIVSKLEEVGFERISYKVRCDTSAVDFEQAQKCDGYVIVKSDVLPDFIAYCEEHGIVYIVLKNEEVEEEIIC